MKKTIILALTSLVSLPLVHAQKAKNPTDSSKQPIAFTKKSADFTGNLILVDSTTIEWNGTHGKGEEVLPTYNNYLQVSEYYEIFGIYQSFNKKTLNVLDLDLNGNMLKFETVPMVNKFVKYDEDNDSITYVHDIVNDKVAKLNEDGTLSMEFTYDNNGNLLTHKTYISPTDYNLDSAVYNNDIMTAFYRISDNGNIVNVNEYSYDVSNKMIAIKYQSFLNNVLENGYIDSLVSSSATIDSVFSYELINGNYELNQVAEFYKHNDYIDSVFMYTNNSTSQNVYFIRNNNEQVTKMMGVEVSDTISLIDFTYHTNNRMHEMIISSNQGMGLTPTIKFAQSYDNLNYLENFDLYTSYNNNTWEYGPGSENIKFYYKTDSTTHISELNANEVTVYPNPTNNSLKINTANSNINEIVVYDINGRIMKRVILKTAEASTTLDVQNLNSGQYILNIYSDKGVLSTKFFKQ
jgi:hypothetical protein